jgi:hypothetical protein
MIGIDEIITEGTDEEKVEKIKGVIKWMEKQPSSSLPYVPCGIEAVSSKILRLINDKKEDLH